MKDGLLTRIDLAWSCDQQYKVYVQDKLREQGAEVWRWLQEGAHIYVCGDMPTVWRKTWKTHYWYWWPSPVL